MWPLLNLWLSDWYMAGATCGAGCAHYFRNTWHHLLAFCLEVHISFFLVSDCVVLSYVCVFFLVGCCLWCLLKFVTIQFMTMIWIMVGTTVLFPSSMSAVNTVYGSEIHARIECVHQSLHSCQIILQAILWISTRCLSTSLKLKSDLFVPETEMTRSVCFFQALVSLNKGACCFCSRMFRSKSFQP